MGKHICQWYLRQWFDLQNIWRTYTFNTQKTNNPIRKWAKDLKRQYSREDIERAQRHMKGCSASLTTWEMQIKTTMRSHFSPIRMASITKSTSNTCWWGWEQKGTLVHCWWECRLVQPLWKTVWKFFTKLKMQLPFDPVIPLLGLCPKNPETPIQKNLCTPMFIVTHNLQ